MDLLSVSDLSMGYDEAPVFEHLSFSLREGDYLAIVGENGSGKSTLVKGLLGLKKPISGDIILTDDAKNRIGYLAQRIETKRAFPASVSEVVLSGCVQKKGALPFYPRALKELAAEKMELLGITELAKRSFHHLSGGQRQRVLLARALCSTESLLLLDEPVAGLDPIVTAQLYEIVRMLNQEQRMTILMVSHDIDAVLQDASHVLYLKDDGYFFGTRAEFVASRAADRLWKGGSDAPANA